MRDIKRPLAIPRMRSDVIVVAMEASKIQQMVLNQRRTLASTGMLTHRKGQGCVGIKQNIIVGFQFCLPEN